MKKTKFLKRSSLLIFLVFTTFWSCQKDDFYENQTSNHQSTDVTFKRISYEKLKTNQKAMEKLGKFSLRSNSIKDNLSNNILKRTVYNEQLGIEIDTIGIVYIEKDGYHSITLQAYQGDENDKKLKNLILNQEKDGSYSEYLLVYDLSDEELKKVENKENVDLIGNTTIYKVTANNYNPSGFPLNDPDCWEDIVIGQVAVPCASGLHMPGQVCDYAGGPGAAYVKDVTIKVISAGCGMGGGGGGSTGGSPGTGGGGSEGGTNPGTGSNPSNPNNPSNPGNTVNPQEPGFADQDGNPINTNPVKNPELLEPEDEEEDCNTSKDDLKKIFPNASDQNMETLATVINQYGKDFGINTKEKLQHFLSQVGHEVGGFTNGIGREENLNYSESRLKSVFKKYFKQNESDTLATKREASGYINNPSALANYVYCCRMGNGDENSGDGYKYRGRGIIQLTGKTNYSDFKSWYNSKYGYDKDFITNPELLKNNDTIAILSALWFYKKRVVDKISIDSTTTVKKITKKINGGTNGLTDRESRFQQAKDSIKCL